MLMSLNLKLGFNEWRIKAAYNFIYYSASVLLPLCLFFTFQKNRMYLSRHIFTHKQWCQCIEHQSIERFLLKPTTKNTIINNKKKS